MSLTFVITGASGFLGQVLCDVAAASWPEASVVPVRSPRAGGIDLAARDAAQRLSELVHLSNPEHTVLIHAAANIAWETPEGFLDNAAMAVHVGRWIRQAGIGFGVLASTVSVGTDTWYGLGKSAAESAWRLTLQQEQRAVVRLAGIWGWQQRPSLFWNRLLLSAAQNGMAHEPPVVKRGASRRNYISAQEGSRCLLQVGAARMAGEFLAAGRDTIDTRGFIEAVQQLPGARLSVDWQDDGQSDERSYTPSPELLEWLEPFPKALARIWGDRPEWVAAPEGIGVR